MAKPAQRRSPKDMPYRGVTDPMTPALMRANHEWAAERIIQHLHGVGFSDIRVSHTPVIGFPGPHAARPSEIAARTGRSKQHINILLGELEAAGYLERCAEGADQRAKVVYLTERGMHLAAAVKDAVESVEAEWRDVLGQRRMAELKRSLERLQAAASQERQSRAVTSSPHRDTPSSPTARSKRNSG